MQQEKIVLYYGKYRGTQHTTDLELLLQSIFVSEGAPLIPELKQAALLPDLPSRAVSPLPIFPLKNVNLSLSPLNYLLSPWNSRFKYEKLWFETRAMRKWRSAQTISSCAKNSEYTEKNYTYSWWVQPKLTIPALQLNFSGRSPDTLAVVNFQTVTTFNYCQLQKCN